MTLIDSILDRLDRFWLLLRRLWQRLIHLYKPSTIRERGWLWASGLFVATYFVVVTVMGILWSSEPDPFDVRQVAQERLGASQEAPQKPVTGYIFTSTLMHIGEVLLGEGRPGGSGYLSNDI